jgi:hypothetical protein
LVTTHRGASTLGCLFTLLMIAVVVYFGINIGGTYWRYYEFQDDMKQEVRFASHNADPAILKTLRAEADSLGLPDDASDITVRRTPNSITIDAEYDERIEVPGYSRLVHFHPRAAGTL